MFAEIVGPDYISDYIDVDSIMDKEWVKVIFADYNTDRILEMHKLVLFAKAVFAAQSAGRSELRHRGEGSELLATLFYPCKRKRMRSF